MTGKARPVLIFDGVCNICSFGVRLVLKHDRGGVFDFAFAQGPVGAELKSRFGLPPSLETITVVDDDRVYIKSEAALYVARRLPFPWTLFGIFRIVPRSCRDWAYDLVARNRYRWFGRRDACMTPPRNADRRFLDTPPRGSI
jgi:predicted DCC family thiol-disulfide oxidoreductase YuxK